MATALRKSDEITLSDPVLQPLGDKGDDGTHLAQTLAPVARSDRRNIIFERVLPHRKQVAIGVDLGDSAVRLAKVSRTTKSRPTLTDYTIVPLPPDVAPGDSKLSDFLRSTLNAFCADASRAEIWTAITSAQVETRYLRIPKVSRRQLAKAAYWTYRREAPFDETTSLFGFDIVGERSDGGVRKYEVMAYTLPLAEIRAIQNLFKSAGHPLTGVTIVPFSLQNVLQAQWLETGDQSVCSLYIGREFSRIDIFEADHMVLSRVIKAGVRSMLDTLKEDLAEIRIDDPLELDHVVSVEELTRSDGQGDSLVGLLAHQLNRSEEDIFNMALPAMERLIGQVERTLKHYALNFDNKQVGRLYIFGEVGIHKRIAELFTEQFGIPSHIIDLFASPHIDIYLPAPQQPNDRYQLIPAMALALSINGQTPNFLFTNDDKERLSRIRLANRVLAAGTAAALLTIAGISFFQKQHMRTAAARIDVLQKRLAHDQPTVDRQLINKLVGQAMAKAAKEKLAVAKYLPLAILSELSALTSGEIHLLQVDGDLSGKSAGKSKKHTPEALKLKGIITGDRLSQDVILAGYIASLNASPLFSHAAVEERTLKTFEKKPAIYFTVHLNLEHSS